MRLTFEEAWHRQILCKRDRNQRMKMVRERFLTLTLVRKEKNHLISEQSNYILSTY
jgi:hypothetical protein